MKAVLACFLLCSLITFSACEEEVAPSGSLEKIGILGKWKLEKRLVNGIANLAVECCDYLSFEENEQTEDLKGIFIATGVGYETIGTFEMDTTENSILFEFNDREKLYGFQLQDSSLSFYYAEGDREISENWRRE